VRRRKVLILVLAALTGASTSAQARQPLGLAAPYALLGGLLGHYAGHFRHHSRRWARARHPTQSHVVAARATPAPQRSGPSTPAPPGGEFPGLVFWPNAADDVLAYVVWPDGRNDRFLAHGYSDIVESIVPRATVASVGGSLCASTQPGGEGSIERIKQTLALDATQSAAIEQVRAGIGAAAARIAGTCESATPRNATDRLHAVVRRLRAIRQAVSLLRTPLQNFYGALSVDQRSRFDQENAKASPGDLSGCRKDIERTTGIAMQTLQQVVQPRDDQRMVFGVLMGTLSRMGEMLSTCPARRPENLAARLDAAERRLSAMLYATQNIRSAVQQLYISLSDEQRERFDAIGGRREQAAR
jgi:hypothetical protein